MTRAEYEKLCASASAYAETLGVRATLRMVVAEGSSITPREARIVLRVFLFAPGEIPREYSAAQGYRPDATDLQKRVHADIRTAAEKLGAMHGT